MQKKSHQKDVENFWKGILHKDVVFNTNADWLPKLEETYCMNVTPTDYNIDRSILDKVVRKIQIHKSPGNDHTIGYWYKHLTSYRDYLTKIFQQQLHADQPLPTWLSTAHTVLLPNN